VDDAAGQSATTARHMNSSMDAIRERNLDISEYSESTLVGVGSLKTSMRDVADSLSQFRIEEVTETDRTLAAIEDLKKIQGARRVYREEEMTALEQARLARASV
jgi:hypothetical protein